MGEIRDRIREELEAIRGHAEELEEAIADTDDLTELVRTWQHAQRVGCLLCKQVLRCRGLDDDQAPQF